MAGKLWALSAMSKQQGRRPIDAFVVYAPFRQFADFEAFVIAKSSPIPPEQLTRAVTTAVHAVDPNQPVYHVATMEERLGIALGPQRANMTLMTAFASLALVLATMGIFGVTAYFVKRRVHEIGIRMALGAIPGDVVRIVLVRGLRLAALGIGLGLAAALVLTRYLGSLHEEISAVDPVALAFAQQSSRSSQPPPPFFPRVRRRASTRPLRSGKSSHIS
jgi:ABC-type antimicrobial peptide transport system permease subunit